MQEIVRNHLVLETGLEKLSKMVKTDQILPQLPPCIRQFLLTFPCQEFEVTFKSKIYFYCFYIKMNFQETSDVRPALAASYHVRCKLDGGHYLAIFATSEMDKVRRRQGRGWWWLLLAPLCRQLTTSGRIKKIGSMLLMVFRTFSLPALTPSLRISSTSSTTISAH